MNDERIDSLFRKAIDVEASDLPRFLGALQRVEQRKLRALLDADALASQLGFLGALSVADPSSR